MGRLLFVLGFLSLVIAEARVHQTRQRVSKSITPGFHRQRGKHGFRVLDTQIANYEADTPPEESSGAVEANLKLSSLLAKDLLFPGKGGRSDEQVLSIHHGVAATYLSALRLRRLMALTPKVVDYWHDFIFMTGRNTKRFLKLGVKVVFAATAGADHFVPGHHSPAQVVRHNQKFIGKALGKLLRDRTLYAAAKIANSMALKGDMFWTKLGKYKHPYIFKDITMSDVLEAYMHFLSHRDSNGDWKKKEVDKTLKSWASKGTYRTSQTIENVVNHPITTGMTILTIIVSIVLICIPEPATSAAGVALLGGTGIFGFVTAGADILAGNTAEYNRRGHLMLILISWWTMENAGWCFDPKDLPKEVFPDGEDPANAEPAAVSLCPRLRCDITHHSATLSGGCGDGHVCLRETLFSPSADEGLLSDDILQPVFPKDNTNGNYQQALAAKRGMGEFYPTGLCVPDVLGANDPSGTRYLVPEGDECTLHRECDTGYCHFEHESSAVSSIQMWDMWQYYDTGNPKTDESDVPDFIRFFLLDSGICRKAVPLDDLGVDGACPDAGLAAQRISTLHKFGACLPPNLDQLSFYDDQDLAARRAEFERMKEHGADVDDPRNANIAYGEPVTVYGRRRGDGADARGQLYAYTWDGWPNYNWVFRLSPESTAPRMFWQEPNDPIKLSTTPHEVAQQGGMLSLRRRVVDNEVRFEAADKGNVKYGDYVAIAWECSPKAARKTARKEGTDLPVKEYRHIVGRRRGGYYPIIKDAYPTLAENGKLVYEHYMVWQVRHEDDTRPQRRLHNGVVVPKHVPVRLVNVYYNREICLNYLSSKDSEQSLVLAGTCDPSQLPRFGQFYERSRQFLRLADPSTGLTAESRLFDDSY